VALDGGPDGLSVITPVVQDAAIALMPGGHVFLEIGEDQGEAVASLLRENGFENVAIDKDLSDRDRYAIAAISR
jgi:release factor glutamine methyltransferase